MVFSSWLLNISSCDTPSKTKMDTKNDDLEMVVLLNLDIFGIYVEFLWGISLPYNKGDLFHQNISMISRSLASQASFGMDFNAWIVLLANWKWLFRRRFEVMDLRARSDRLAISFTTGIPPVGKTPKGRESFPKWP